MSVPVVDAVLVKGKGGWVAVVICPYCGKRHQHGAGTDGTADGHRVAHCDSPRKAGASDGYILRFKSPPAEPRRDLGGARDVLGRIAAARANDYHIVVRLYCESTGCAARDITINCKDHDSTLLSMPKGKPCCPFCRREDVTCHYAITWEQHQTNEETEARASVNRQMWLRDERARRNDPTALVAMTMDKIGDERLPPTPNGWWGKIKEFVNTHTFLSEGKMPKVSIYIEGQDVSVVTDANDERDFTEGFTPAFSALIAQNGKNPPHASRSALTAAFDIVAKLRGYKSGVQERRVLAAGRWPHPNEKPAAETASEDAPQAVEGA